MSVELALVVLAYLLGSVPTAYLLVRATTGEDVRTKGTGNVGGTNAMRAAMTASRASRRLRQCFAKRSSSSIGRYSS